MAAFPVALRRTGAALLLAGFMAQAADGVMTALCVPAGSADHPATTMLLEDDTRATPASGAHAGHHPAAEPTPDGLDHDRDHSEHDPACPFGGEAVLACGGAPTAPARAPLTRALPLATADLEVPEPDQGAGALIAEAMFRPPRA